MSRSLADLDPDVRQMCQGLLTNAKAEGIYLLVTQTYRTPEQQAALYAQGRTAPGKIVTHAPPGYSWHEFRRAFDVAIQYFPGDKTKTDFWDGPWDQIGDMGEALGLEWGGRWSKPDRPHFQHTNGKTLAQMRASRAPA